MIVVIGRVRTDDARRAELVRIAQDVARASREEDACLGYRFYADSEDPDAYVFVEEWDSLAGLREHFGTSHIATFMAAIKDAITAPPDVDVHVVSETISLADAAASA